MRPAEAIGLANDIADAAETLRATQPKESL
jgi:hypothetical protein